MDYEKKYNEALERASHIKDNNTVATPQEVAEHIFPELRELSEELPSWESAWLAIQKMENYLTELEESE